MTARQPQAGFRFEFEKPQFICSLQSIPYSQIADNGLFSASF
jgi:hypothetical protein